MIGLLLAVALLPNTTVVCSEGCVITAVSSPTAVLQFGAGSLWNTISAPKFPLTVSCLSTCPQLGGDPDPGVVKTISAVQQATAYTVTYTLNGGTVTKTIPAKVPSWVITCTTAALPNPLPGTFPATCTSVKQ